MLSYTQYKCKLPFLDIIQEGDTIVVSVQPGGDSLVFQRVSPGGEMPPEEEEVKAEGPTSGGTHSSSSGPQAGGGAPATVVVSAPSRPIKFDPLKKMSQLQVYKDTGVGG